MNETLSKVVGPQPWGRGPVKERGVADRTKAAAVALTVPLGRMRPQQNSGFRATTEWAAVLICMVLVAAIVRMMVLQTFLIPSESMANTLQVGDNIMVDKVSHRMVGVSRGDVVVFKKPVVLKDDGITDLVKRVIAVEGDTVEAVDGEVYINGVLVSEPYLAELGSTFQFSAVTVGEDQLFVMGDNRTRSGDSRVFGVIAESSVVGRPQLVVWPVSRLRFVN